MKTRTSTENDGIKNNLMTTRKKFLSVRWRYPPESKLIFINSVSLVCKVSLTHPTYRLDMKTSFMHYIMVFETVF